MQNRENTLLDYNKIELEARARAKQTKSEYVAEVSPEVLKMADAIVELPMFGVNISLNVMVSLGIVLFKVIEKSLL